MSWTLRWSTGQQWLSWIGIDDLTDIYYRALVDGRLAGPVNPQRLLAAGHPFRHLELGAALRHLLGRTKATANTVR
jgi:NAD dependent epimerase/dehydratase family enzyme